MDSLGFFSLGFCCQIASLWWLYDFQVYLFSFIPFRWYYIRVVDTHMHDIASPIIFTIWCWHKYYVNTTVVLLRVINIWGLLVFNLIAAFESIWSNSRSFIVSPSFINHTSTMAPKLCALCETARAILRRPKTGQQICRDCFFYVFETEVHNTVTEAKLFKTGDRVAIGASGGKGKRSRPDEYGRNLTPIWSRFNSVGLCHENVEWTLSLWAGTIPAVHRWGYNWISRRLTRGRRLALSFFGFHLWLTLFYVDCEAKSTAI